MPRALSVDGMKRPAIWRMWTPCDCWRLSAKCFRRDGKIFKGFIRDAGEFARSPAACAAARNTLGVFDIVLRFKRRRTSGGGTGQVCRERSRRLRRLDFIFGCRVWPHPPALAQTLQTLPAETESREDSIFVRSYVIDARVKPPKNWMRR